MISTSQPSSSPYKGRYIALCTRFPANDLVSAECASLTGNSCDEDGVALCSSIEYVKRAAYIHSGLEMIAQGNSLEELVSALIPLEIDAEQFRLEYINSAGHPPEQRLKTILGVADALKAYPNLEAPLNRFAIVHRKTEMFFGRLIVEADRSYQIHETKPWHTSSSLPARLARAMVNLAGTEVNRIVDPCCGSGSILLEACAIGLQAVGLDINPRMVGMTKKNLSQFNYQAQVSLGDAKDCELTADAVVTDLPYGLYSHTYEENLLGILQHAVAIAPMGIFAVGSDLTPLFVKAGYKEIEVFKVRKRREMSRYILRAR